MNICLLTPYYHPIKGGITNFVYFLSKSLIEKKYETNIITNRGKKDASNVYIIDKNKIVFILKVFIQIRRLRPNVLHSHANWYMLVPCVLYKFFNPKTVLVHTFHTDPIESINVIKLKIMKLLLSRCDHITFVSIYLKNKMIRYYTNNVKTKVIYGGFSPAKINEIESIQFRKKFNIDNNYPIISFVGVLSWKMKAEGVKILVRAFKLLLEKYPQARLMIVGDGIFKKNIELLVNNMGIRSKVIFTGFVDNAMIPLSISDIYSHISLQEGGFPLTMIEAMSLGKPVISPEVGGVPEVIVNYENGIIVKADENEIVFAIIELLENRDLMKKISANAIKTVNKRFMWDYITNQFLDVYNQD